MHRWTVSCCWAASILQHHDFAAEKAGQLINQHYLFYKSDCITNNAHFFVVAIPLQAWTDPEGSRRLKVVRLSALRTSRFLGINFYVAISVMSQITQL